jgi:D-alanyl-D-alanine carboxypeptidase
VRRWRRWLIPVLLAVGVVAGASTAWRIETAVPDPAPTAGAGDHPLTPILSVRRVPSLVAAPIAAQRLHADLDALVGLLPADSCLVVEGPDLRYAHRADAPLVPASTAKLLTATAALEAPATGVTAGDERLADVVGHMLRESDDRVAERLLDGIGRAMTGGTADGAAAAEALLDDGSVDLAGVRIVDGSGHSLENRVTCDALVDVLGRAGTGPVLQAGLPVAAESGTLAERFRGTPLAGVLRAKTGSLTSVAALAGVLEDDDPPLTFALIVNMPARTPVPEDVERLQLQIGERLAAWPRVPAAARLAPVTDDG